MEIDKIRLTDSEEILNPGSKGEVVPPFIYRDINYGSLQDDNLPGKAVTQEVRYLPDPGNENRAAALIKLTKANDFELSDVVKWLNSDLSDEQVEHILRNPILASTHWELFKSLYPSLDQKDFLPYLLSIQPQGKYLEQEQIEGTLAIIQRINHSRTPGWEENNLIREIAILRQANISGTDKLVYDLFNGNYTGTDYLGSRFQLTWVNAHLERIEEIEKIRPKGTKGVDVLLKDGTFVDTKSVQHLSLPGLQLQVDAYARDFPALQGHTLSFVLDSSVTTFNPKSIKRLEERLQAYTQQKAYPFAVNVSIYP